MAGHNRKCVNIFGRLSKKIIAGIAGILFQIPIFKVAGVANGKLDADEEATMKADAEKAKAEKKDKKAKKDK